MARNRGPGIVLGGIDEPSEVSIAAALESMFPGEFGGNAPNRTSSWNMANAIAENPGLWGQSIGVLQGRQDREMAQRAQEAKEWRDAYNTANAWGDQQIRQGAMQNQQARAGQRDQMDMLKAFLGMQTAEAAEQGRNQRSQAAIDAATQRTAFQEGNRNQRAQARATNQAQKPPKASRPVDYLRLMPPKMRNDLHQRAAEEANNDPQKTQALYQKSLNSYVQQQMAHFGDSPEVPGVVPVQRQEEDQPTDPTQKSLPKPGAGMKKVTGFMNSIADFLMPGISDPVWPPLWSTDRR